MEYTIENLQEKDIALYKNLMDECFGGSSALEKYQAYYQNRSYKIFVIKRDDKVIASATQYAIDLFTFDFQPCLMLFNIAVRKDYRREKLATILLEQIIKQAREDGYKSISLTCLDSAYPAHKLYESVGFSKASSIKYNLTL